MATDVSVVIAYRDMGDPHRRRSFDDVRAWYEQYSFAVTVVGDVEPFGRAAAINAGVARCGGDIIIQSDPDSLVPVGRLTDAIALAREAPGLVVPHDEYLYLTPAATDQWLSGGRFLYSFGPADCEFHGINGMGNVVVFSRDTWARAGGFDERFGLWGGDDAAFAYACDALVAPLRRLSGSMIHLWHPRLPQSQPGHPGYQAQMSILGRYRDAAAIGPDAIKALVAAR